MEILLALGSLAVGAIVGAKLLAPTSGSANEAWWIFYTIGPTRDDKVDGVFLGYGNSGRDAALAKSKEWFDLRFGSNNKYFTAFVVAIANDRVTHAADLQLVASQVEAGAQVGAV